MNITVQQQAGLAAPRLPDLEVPNMRGSCWTCVEQGTESSCDRSLPFCRCCTDAGRTCAGYQARLKWTGKSRRTPSTQAAQAQAVALISAVSSVGLPSEDSLLLQHFIKNICRMSLAVDYDGNGYRRFAATALNDQALLNALLAWSESHYCRWQRKEDTQSKTQLRRSFEHLQQRLVDPQLARSEVTLMTMIVLLVYDLCEGNERWKQHYTGVIAWLRHRKDCSDIDPFLTGVLTTISTQVILHQPGPFRDQSYTLLDTLIPFQGTNGAVDVMLGCSLDLPELIMEAGRLHDDVRRASDLNDNGLLSEVCVRATALQARIQLCRIGPETCPKLGYLSRKGASTHTVCSLTPADPSIDTQTREATRASAEIHRLALHVFVHRIIHDPMITGGCPPEIRSATDEVFELLPLVPDTIGPGSFLGWALVVIGAEVDRFDQREHVKRRLESLALLEMNHGVLGLAVLDEIWRRRDLVTPGLSNSKRCRWQEVMEDMDVDLALI